MMKKVFRKNFILLLISIAIWLLFPCILYAQDGTEKWAFETGGSVFSSPAIGSDGTIYVGSSDNKLYAVNPDGTQKWAFATGYSVDSTPAIASDGTIYVGSADNKLYAINSDGTQKWGFETGDYMVSSPAIASDGTIYVGSDDNKLYAINPDGTEKWAFETGGSVFSSPAIASDGTIYVGSNDNKLYAINPDGSRKWAFETGGGVLSSPSIASGGTIYVGSDDNKLYAVNPDGTLKWAFQTGADVCSSPAIASDGTIYVGSWDNKLYAINPDSTHKWAFETGNIVFSSPSIASDGTIYVGSYDNKLYAVNPDGTLKWYFEIGNDVGSSPSIASDGTIYVGSWDNNLYAINGSSGGLANSPWPMFHHDLQHTGRKQNNGGNDKTNISLSMDCNTTPASPGKTHPITIGIDTDNLTIGGLDFILTFDPNQVTPASVSATGMAQGSTVLTSNPASGQYRVALTYASGFSGTGDILHIDLNVVPNLCNQPPPSTLQVGIASVAKAYDLAGSEINAGFSAGTCNITLSCDIPDGDVAPLGNRDGKVNVGDSLVCLRFALGLETPTQEDTAHGDVAPLDSNNQPNPDGQINVGDALVILRMALGIIDQVTPGPMDVDDDGDGFTENQGDCNDNNPNINPEATEICNDNIDNDCDGYIDCKDQDCFSDPACKPCTDDDHDGYYLESDCGTAVDCNDNNANINPGATEICNDTKDNDCDGYADCDDPDCLSDFACKPCTDYDHDGYYSESGCGTALDCNDNNANIHPGATEIPYDGIDQDCSDADLTDVDGDGYTSKSVGGADCNDNNYNINPGMSEICNDNIDNDCDRYIDCKDPDCSGSSECGPGPR